MSHSVTAAWRSVAGDPASPATERAEQGVLAALGGLPLSQAAALAGMSPADLADAISVYRAAGNAALRASAASGWIQVLIEFADWNAAEQAAAQYLAPRLRQAQDAAEIGEWWFLRKHPCWRLRIRPASQATGMPDAIRVLLDDLTGQGRISGWRQGVYEPETLAFGGRGGVEIAHQLFCADSRAVLDYASRAAAGETTIGRRELTLLICGSLLRASGLDWFEKGDVWHRVTRLRPLPGGTPASQITELAGTARRLITATTSPGSALLQTGAPLAFAAPWITAFGDAGHAMAKAASDGSLERGLRDVLAHLVIFHWNRLGLADRTQAILARAAADAIFSQPASGTGRP